MSDAAAGLVRLRSAHSVEETLARLHDLLAQHGIGVACHVSHSAAAAKAGLTMPQTELLLFGNPNAGTPLMLESPTLAIDLPLKALLSQDAKGAVWLSYNSIEYLRERHHVTADMSALAAAEPLFRQAVAQDSPAKT